MGLIKAAVGATGGALADTWKELIYCESIPAEVLVVKGSKKTSSRSSNTKRDDNVISDGSGVIVNNGQCMIIVEQGKVVEFCAEPGEFIYNNQVAPSLFTGNLGDSIKATFANIGKRFTFGGDTGVDQRVYYFNTKEIMGNKYGTTSPVPFRVVDQNVGLDIDISVRCNGEYSYKIVDPILFYTNVCGNIEEDYNRSEIDSQLRTEILTALQPAFAQISGMGIRYSAVPSHTMELTDVLNEVLSKKWHELRGIEIASFGMNAISASEEDEKMIKDMQRSGALRDPSMRAATIAGAQAEAMVDAANNQGGMGAMGGFIGMGMAQGVGGMNAQQMAGVPAGQPVPTQYPVAEGGGFAPAPTGSPVVVPEGGTWICPKCGASCEGKFCPECGAPKPPVATADAWTCPTCGASCTGKFCSECGAPKPQAAASWKCPKCGAENTGKFCSECGTPQ